MTDRPLQTSGTLAVVIGRAGSKGMPGKNAMLIGGRPAVCWSIDAARRAHLVNHIVVSTDCAGVRAAAVGMRARVIDRPSSLAADDSTVDDAVRHAVCEHERASGEQIERVVILYASVPVRPQNLIDRAVTKLVRAQADSVQSYSPVGKHHPWWTVKVSPETGIVSSFGGGPLNAGIYRRQELPDAYIPDGGVIAVTRAALMLELPNVPDGPHRFLGCDVRGITTNPGDVVDVDGPVDAQVASVMLSASTRRNTA